MLSADGVPKVCAGLTVSRQAVDNSAPDYIKKYLLRRRGGDWYAGCSLCVKYC